MTWAVPYSSIRVRAAAGCVALMALTACDTVGDFSLGNLTSGLANATPLTGAVQQTETTERDVEAPQVFSATEAGLWDGRPSLGGIWVAHPDVTEPERVIVRNQSNGKFVVGALFRRARDIPGPRLQVSSDAAEALGMLAGAPNALDVTALRREEVPVEVSETAQTLPSAAEVAEARLDPIATAEAALTEAETAAPQPVLEQPTTLSKPFIQIGIFSIEANADRTAQQMRSAGIVPTIKTFSRDDKPFWRVVVGPASTASERRLLLEKIREQGFSDAYAVTN